jgi:hypothetical protein
MQQATQIKEQAKSVTHANPSPPGAAGSSFVINLCSSTSPVALSPPDHAGLKRFTFFVSRRREEGRERFRLHMGYFGTQEEAEKLLDIVREIYPGAWAGLAPGQRLRAAAAAASAANQAVSAPVEQEVPPATVALPVNAAPAPTPTLPAAAVPAPRTESTPPAEPVAAKPKEVAAKEVAAEVVSFQLIPDERGRRLPEPASPAAVAASVSTAAESVESAKSKEPAAARTLSDVRAAIASLDDSAERAPVLRPHPDLKIPELKPAVMSPSVKKTMETTGKPGPKIDERSTESSEELDDEAAMALLEERGQGARAPAAGGNAATAAPHVEKAVYAVQLVWSVQPIDISQVPQLAIFSAYTLYGAEGNRDGRRWYGLRLGFFTDAVSAKQVAHYVRSEFSTVSVVPVTARERDRAKNTAAPAPGVGAEARLNAPIAPKPAGAVNAGTNLVSTTKFEFIEDKPLAAEGESEKASPARLAPGPRTGRGAPGKRAKLRTPAQAAARAKPKKLTLEETLEILGAGELKVDDGRRPLLDNDSGANAAAPKPQGTKSSKPSRLGRLFERLSERIGN